MTALPACSSAMSCADVVCTVSNYVASLFGTVSVVAGPSLRAAIADSVQIRYPGVPPAAFDAP